MKFLYVARERQSAEAAGLALRGVGPDVAVSWAADLGPARRWIEDNQDVSVLIIEVDSDSRSFEALINHARGVGVKVPVIGIPLSDSRDVLLSVRAVADEVVPRHAGILDELPHAVRRVLCLPEAPHPQVPVVPDTRQLEWQLRDTEAVAARAEQRAQEALSQLRAREAAWHAAMEQEHAVRAALEQRLADVEAVRHRSEAETVSVQDSRDSARVEHESPETQALAHELAEAKRILLLADDLHASIRADATARIREVEEQAEARLAEAARATNALQCELADTLVTLRGLERTSSAERAALMQQLADRDAASRLVEEQAATDRRAAAQEAARYVETDRAHRVALQALEAARDELDTRVVAAADARRRLEDEHAATLADARAALDAAERRAHDQRAEATAATQSLETRLAAALEDAGRAAAQQAALDLARAEAVSGREALAAELAARDLGHRDELHALDARRQDLESRLAAADERFRRADGQHASALEAARAALSTVEQRAARQQADAAAAARALEAQAAQARQQADSRAAQAAGALAALQATLVEQAAALLETERQANADRHDAAEQAARRQAEFDTGLAQEIARRQHLAARLADAEAGHQRAAAEHAAAMAAAHERLSTYQHEAESSRAALAAALEQQQAMLADATAALQRAEAQAASDRQAAAQRAAGQHAEFDAALARERAGAEALATQLAEQDAAREREAHERQSEIESWRGRLSETQQHADAQVRDALAQVAKLDARLAESAAAVKRAHAQAAHDRTVAAEQAAAQREEFETTLAREVATRQALESQLFEEQGARQRAAAQSATDLASAQEDFARQLEAAESRFAAAEQQHAATIAAADARLAEATATAAATLQAARQHDAAERQAAADQFATERAALEAALAQQAARRESADHALSALQTAAAAAERRFVDGIAAMRQQTAEHDTRLRERAARERAEWEATLADRQQKIGQLELDGELTRRSLAAGEVRIRQLEAANAEERGALASLQATFAQAQAAAQQGMEAVAREHDGERAQWQATLAERERQLAEQATSHAAARTAAASAMADVEQQLRATREAGQRDARTIAQLEHRVAALTQDLTALDRQRDTLAREADRVPLLQQLIDDTQAEYRLRFDRTPMAMWRSGPDGAILQANHALASLLQYKSVDELLPTNLSATVFESADELQWLIDRCLASRSPETVETTWRTRDGAGLVVQLLATAASADAVDFVAIDITARRSLEEKLHRSQRMESVARYASEVAATCDRLLGQVHQQGQQWLTGIESDAVRHQGAMLLDDVTRAAGFLRQLTAYGIEQKNTPDVVEVQQVLRDLGPVLNRVAGRHVELVMPRTSPPCHLDVERHRVERILVNVAAYGRERMPAGGRLVIDVSPAVIDRTFVDKYPNVRPGAHVLLTVNEERETPGQDWPAAVRDHATVDGPAPAPRPGVDLGALQALVGDCGGHLWILAEPTGNMSLRIHLPRRMLDDRAPARKAGRGRWMSRLAAARSRATA